MYKYINIKTQTIRYLQEYSASLRFLFWWSIKDEL
jgi:hypothetical protein